jgi:hypothetical protein
LFSRISSDIYGHFLGSLLEMSPAYV